MSGIIEVLRHASPGIIIRNKDAFYVPQNHRRPPQILKELILYQWLPADELENFQQLNFCGSRILRNSVITFRHSLVIHDTTWDVNIDKKSKSVEHKHIYTNMKGSHEILVCPVGGKYQYR